jgi:hypothetical protein
LAGTDNAIYMDVGPVGWQLNGDENLFEKGADRRYDLPVPASFTTDDLLWIRLHKKGVGGFLNMTDGPDGAWKPSEVELLVNGESYYKVEVNQWLDRQHPFWIVEMRAFSPNTAAERFLRSLRVTPNRPLTPAQESLARLTTPFKIMGISGWLPGIVPSACATGVVRQAFVSTDGLTTIDLALRAIEVGGSTSILDGQHGIPHQRFLRVESRFGDGQGRRPGAATGMRICGAVRWDSDNEGWYEIHPRAASDLTILPNNP